MTFKQHIEKYTQENGLTAKMAERNIKIDDICNYITEQAKKELDSKDGAIDDKTVFGWAVHYIEDAYKDKTKPKKVADVSDSPDDEEKVETKTEEKKEEKHYEQLSLFDMFGDK